jgi:transposase
MVDVNDDAKAGFRRIEVLTGPGRRRRWSADEKTRVVAETLEPGARVSEIARRWQICPQQVFGWRRQARLDLAGSRSEPAPCSLPPFVPLVAEAAPTAKVAVPTPPSAVIEIKLAGAAVRVVSGVDGDLLTAVLRAVRSSSGAA